MLGLSTPTASGLAPCRFHLKAFDGIFEGVPFAVICLYVLLHTPPTSFENSAGEGSARVAWGVGAAADFLGNEALSMVGGAGDGSGW